MYTTLPGIKNLKISHTGLDKVFFAKKLQKFLTFTTNIKVDETLCSCR